MFIRVGNRVINMDHVVAFGFDTSERMMLGGVEQNDPVVSLRLADHPEIPLLYRQDFDAGKALVWWFTEAGRRELGTTTNDPFDFTVDIVAAWRAATQLPDTDPSAAMAVENPESKDVTRAMATGEPARFREFT